ncbi:MAG: TadE/TadG family type IV pilus assembly protein [Beijerinckiaceae bacterium]
MFRRFRKQQEGATAVEFAIVAMPFFGMIMAVLELAIFFFASRTLEDALFNASRKVLTQSLPAGNICTEFKNELQRQLPKFMDIGSVTISATPLTSFSGSGASANFASGGCSFGARGSVVVLTVSYPYPFQGFKISESGPRHGKGIELWASTAFRVEN